MRTLFPATYSTLSPDALVSFLSTFYNWQHVKCRLLLRGVGDTYLVEADGVKYILRIYRTILRSYSQIATEVELLTLLRQSGIPVSYPIADKNGAYIHPFAAAEGTKHGVLFSYAQGKPAQILNTMQLKTLGKEMARFHDVSSKTSLINDRWRYNIETTLVEPLKAVKKFIGENSGELEWLTNASEKAVNVLKALDGSSFSTGYCHYDLMPKNFHFDESGQITFFDFDFLGYGWLVNDLMSFRVSLNLDVFYDKISQDKADDSFRVFLEAYQQQRLVSEAELSAMPYLELGFWVFYLGFYTTHDQFFPLLQEPHLQRRLQLIRQLAEKNGF